MTSTRSWVTLAACLLLPAGMVAFASPAAAIQTTAWGIRPAAVPAGPRASLQYPSNGQSVHDSVVVYNRTDRPEVIDLSVLAAGYRGGAYQYSPRLTGLAGRIDLSARRVLLPPHQQARVPLTVEMPAHSAVTTLAAIAAEGAPIDDGTLLVQQRLVVLVRATPSTVAAAGPDLGLWGSLAAALLGVVAGLAGLEIRRRRRSTAAGPPRYGARQAVGAGVR